MKKLFLIAFPLYFCFSCAHTREVSTYIDEDVEIISVEGLLPLNKSWQQDSSIIWTYVQPDSIWTELSLKDSSDYPNYRITEVFRNKISGSLKITKRFSWDPKKKTPLHEVDIYEKRLTEFLQSRLSISYDYQNRTYHTDFLDTLATDEKLKANEARLDSMNTYASENNLYLCGTAAHEILWEDVPFLPVPKEIEKEEALKIAKAWMKE